MSPLICGIWLDTTNYKKENHNEESVCTKKERM